MEKFLVKREGRCLGLFIVSECQGNNWNLGFLEVRRRVYKFRNLKLENVECEYQGNFFNIEFLGRERQSFYFVVIGDCQM